MQRSRDRFILTPASLGETWHGLRPLAEEDWVVLDPARNDDTAAVRTATWSAIAAETERALERGERPVSIAGDCCSTFGVAAGLRRSGVDATLVWFDAHGDFNTPETSPSGFLGGMPLAILVGRGDTTPLRDLSLTPLPEEDVVLVDARDLDPGEREQLATSRIRHARHVEDLLESDALPPGDLWVHFDTDVIDPSEGPAHRFVAPGGPSVAALSEVFRHLSNSRRIVAISVSTWEPALDEDGRSRGAALAALDALRGEPPGNLLIYD